MEIIQQQEESGNGMYTAKAYTVFVRRISMELQNEVMIERVFDAARRQAWQMWTQCQKIMHWWGPKTIYLFLLPDGFPYRRALSFLHAFG